MFKLKNAVEVAIPVKIQFITGLLPQKTNWWCHWGLCAFFFSTFRFFYLAIMGMGYHGFYLWVGKIPWRRKWQPTPVSLPGKSHGQRSLVGCSPWGCKELGTTEQLTLNLIHRYMERAIFIYLSLIKILLWLFLSMFIYVWNIVISVIYRTIIKLYLYLLCLLSFNVNAMRPRIHCEI